MENPMQTPFPKNGIEFLLEQLEENTLYPMEMPIIRKFCVIYNSAHEYAPFDCDYDYRLNILYISNNMECNNSIIICRNKSYPIFTLHILK